MVVKVGSVKCEMFREAVFRYKFMRSCDSNV